MRARAAIATAMGFMSVTLGAQRPASDVIDASSGRITISPIIHASVQVDHGTQSILVDPMRAPSDSTGPARPSAATLARYGGLMKPTMILVTDIHEDHLDPALIAAVRMPVTIIVIPAIARSALGNAANVHVLANGERQTLNGVMVEAVPMYNLAPDQRTGVTYHTKGRGNGYIVTLGGKRLYFAGDTACTPEMKALTSIDVAFLPMNLPYTMSPKDAGSCARSFKPSIVYPYHYLSDDPTLVDTFVAAMRGSGIDVRVHDWYIDAK